jgi:hypothetical protein
METGTCDEWKAVHQPLMNEMVTYTRELLFQAYTSKYATYLFLLWCGVSAVDSESIGEGSSDKNVGDLAQCYCFTWFGFFSGNAQAQRLTTAMLLLGE